MARNMTERRYAESTIHRAVNARGRVHFNSWTGKFTALPFGTLGPNGATFAKSVLDPDSSLVRVLTFLYFQGGFATKREICEGVFDFMTIRKPIRSRVTGRRSRTVRIVNDRAEVVNLSGWRAAWFADLKRAGFVVQDKFYNLVLTELGIAVVKYNLNK